MSRELDCKNAGFQLKLTKFRTEIFNFEKMTLLMSRWKLVVLSCMTVMIKSSRDYYCTTNQNKLFQLWFYKVPSCHFRFKIFFSEIERFKIRKFENFNKMVCRRIFKRIFVQNEKFLEVSLRNCWFQFEMSFSI